MRVTEVIEDPIMQILTLETLLADAAFESIPESIIQIDGLLKQNYEDIQTIQIIGVISSIIQERSSRRTVILGSILASF